MWPIAQLNLVCSRPASSRGAPRALGAALPYLVLVGLAGLVVRLRPEGSALGVGVSAAAPSHANPGLAEAPRQPKHW